MMLFNGLDGNSGLKEEEEREGGELRRKEYKNSSEFRCTL
jgi:hypothetical protein